MKIFKVGAITLSMMGFVAAVSPANAWDLYSWDRKYKCECHFFENPLGGTSVVCGNWNPAIANTGNLDDPPKKLRSEMKLNQVPRLYVKQVNEAMGKYKQITKKLIKQ